MYGYSARNLIPYLMRLFCYIVCRRSYYLAEMAQSVATGRMVRNSNPG